MTPLDQAFALHQAGRLAEAERLYRAILAGDAGHAAALHLLGLIAVQGGEAERAAALIGRAIAIEPAAEHLRYNRGVALQQQERLEEAAGCYRAANLLAPGHAEALSNLGTILQKLGRPLEAVRCYRTAARLKPLYADAWNNLGSALADLGHAEEAVPAYETAVRLDPGHVQAHTNLGLALKSLGRLEQAADAYAAAIRLKPGHAEAMAERLYCLRQLCDWRETERLERELLAQPERFSPFLPLLIDCPSDQRLAIARRWSAQHERIDPLPAGYGPRGPRIRLGYLSADFCNHAVAQLIAELIERHDRQRFDIIAYSYGPDDGSELRQRLEKGFDRFIDVRPLSDLDAARLIREDQIDILVDLTGYTANARTAILARKPAPVQVNFLGYPGTMGAGFIDCIIADPICIPQEDEAFFSEKVVRLPDCYQPNDSKRQIAELGLSRSFWGLPEQGMVFCCFNGSVKLTRPLFALWMRLLHKLPGSVLWLLETSQGAKANLRREAESAGILPERLVFAPKVVLPQHLERQRLADLFLDTLPYNAHTTASDALWAGLPVLTCRGDTFAGRVAASLLTAVGLKELITASLDEYEALALALGSDPARLAALKAKLAANRGTAPLFDAERFARNIEAAYEGMLG